MVPGPFRTPDDDAVGMRFHRVDMGGHANIFTPISQRSAPREDLPSSPGGKSSIKGKACIDDRKIQPRYRARRNAWTGTGRPRGGRKPVGEPAKGKNTSRVRPWMASARGLDERASVRRSSTTTIDLRQRRGSQASHSPTGPPANDYDVEFPYP